MKQEICPICFDINKVSFKTICCEQYFHEKCFKEWAYKLKHYNCPLCRSFVYAKTIPELEEKQNLWIDKIEFAVPIFDFLYIICGLSPWFLLGYIIYISTNECIIYFDLNYEHIIF